MAKMLSAVATGRAYAPAPLYPVHVYTVHAAWPLRVGDRLVGTFIGVIAVDAIRAR